MHKATSFLILVTCWVVCSLSSSSSTLVESASTSSEQRSWQWCVNNIGRFFVPKKNIDKAILESRSHDESQSFLHWTKEGEELCGFKNIDLDLLKREAFFPQVEKEIEKNNKNKKMIRHTFVGDSTSLRAYATAANLYVQPVPRVKVTKLRQSPPFTYSKLKSKTEEERATEIRFSRLVHVSLWSQSMNWTLRDSVNGGMVSISLGNWDLNWRVQPNYKIPGLDRKDYAAVKIYWTKYVQELFNFFDDYFSASFSASSSSPPPILLVKEQLMPNCLAGRFQPKKYKGKIFERHCSDQIVPVIVPMYRRVVAAAAWSRNIPVIPMDHLFRHGTQICAATDGIHLDPRCMEPEQQLIWNVYLLLKRRGVVQTFAGEGKNRREKELKTVDALDISAFNKWWCSQDFDPCNGKSEPSSSIQKRVVTRNDDNDKETESPPSTAWSSSSSSSPSTDSPSLTSPEPSSSPSSSSITKEFRPSPGISDILTLSLILVLPVAFYVLLRSSLS